MAEERTEQATLRRREEARRRGEAPRSAELAGAAALAGALVGLRLGAPDMLAGAARMARWGLHEGAQWDPSIAAAADLGHQALAQALRLGVPAALGAVGAALMVNLAQTGFLVSAHPLACDWRRLSLGAGLRRLCSRRGAFAAARALLKASAVGLVTLLYLRRRWPEVLGLARGSALAAGAGLGGLAWGLLLQVGGVMVGVALADYAFQRREHEQHLRMTRHELKEEHRRTEGDPLVRARVRERQRAIARHRMVEATKRASVVVVNPTAIAVALRYDARAMSAPVVVAKGQRLTAERIREVAERHGVPIMQDPPLARALYRSVPLGRPIPPELYQAVAEILAFVYRMAGREVR